MMSELEVTNNHSHESCRECDGDLNLIRNTWCLKCPKFDKEKTLRGSRIFN